MREIVNIVSSYARYLLGLVAIALLTPFILDRIGVEAYGLWALCLAVTGLLGLLDLGFNTAAVKFVAECAGNGRSEARNEALTTLLVIYALFGLAILGLVQLAIPACISWFRLSPAEGNDFRMLLNVTGAVIAAGLPLSLFRSTLVGQGRYDIVNAVDVVVIGLNALLVYLALEAGLGLIGLAAANAFMVLAPSLILIPIAFRIVPQLALSARRFSPGRLREVAPLAVWFLLANVALLITLRSDALLVKAYLPLSAVAAFAIAAKVAEFAYLLNKQFSNALMPVVSRSHGVGDREAIRAVLLDGTRYLTLVSTPVLLLLIVHAEALIVLWVGPGLLDAVLPLRILLCAVFFSTLQFNAANVLGMAGSHRRVAWILIGSAGLNIALTLVLIPLFGLPGAALATLTAAVCVELILMLSAACRRQGVRAGTFLRSTARIAPAAASLAVASLWLASTFPVTSLVGLMAQSAVAGVIYLAVALGTAIRADERRKALKWLSALWRRRTAARMAAAAARAN
jgi:O-antigen/teichoic acid export membrane protein